LKEAKDLAGRNEQEERQVTIIRNRDIPLLGRVVSVMQDIRVLEERASFERGRTQNITQHLSGMPRGGGVSAGFEAAFAAIAGLEEEHRERVMDYARELREAERILNAIPNRNMRTFVMMMYVENLPPAKVILELNMTEWAFRLARTAVEQAKDMESVQWKEKYELQEEPNGF
jgi:hypothetical protein